MKEAGAMEKNPKSIHIPLFTKMFIKTIIILKKYYICSHFISFSYYLLHILLPNAAKSGNLACARTLTHSKSKRHGRLSPINSLSVLFI